MAIILEGPDNCGKSTLAKQLNEELGFIIVPSEGREKFPGEINARVKRYNEDYGDNVIFDRHPVVSQEMYRQVVKNSPIEESLIDDFYSQGHIFIYCRPNATDRKMQGHQAQDYDDPKYLRKIEERYGPLTRAYDLWALTNAHFIYRIGDRIDLLTYAIREGAKI